MSTFSLKKTNVRLTGNIKLVIDTQQNMFIESINSTEWLSMTMYKGFEWSDALTYGSNVKNFSQMFTNTDVLYDVKNESSINVSNNLENQYHQLYDYGCYSEESQLIDENFRFFAPIYLSSNKDSHPDKFIILKMSGAKLANETSKDWFTSGTLVHAFDLLKIKNKVFSTIEESYIDMSYEDVLSAYGRTLDSGLSNRIEEHVVTELLESETTITEFDNWVTNIFKRHGLVFDNIVNLEFAFTDTEIDNKFVRYAGFYVKTNDISKQELDAYENSGVLRLYETANSVIKYDNSLEIQNYDVQSFSMFANSFGVEKKSIIEFSVQLNPSKGSVLRIFQNDQLEHSIVFIGSNIGQTIEDTKLLIINDINTKYQGKTSSVSAKLVNNNILLFSNSIYDNNLRLEVPISFIVKKPIFSLASYNNNFIGSTNRTISLNTYVNPDKYSKIMYLVDDVKIMSSIVQVYNYLGDWFYELSDTIQHSSKSDNVWFIETKQTKPLLCSILEHREFDMFTELSEYSDVLDFDIQLYKKYLIDTIADDAFIGSALTYFDVQFISDIPSQIVNDIEVNGLTFYKNLLIDRITAFFNSIDVNTNFLLNDIDLSSFEATNVSNEYDRLSENTNVSLRSVNHLYQYVNKWSKQNGLDVYGHQYKLNIAQPFRYDNFSPSTKDVNRDLRYHTHSWFILGEGMPPYYDITEKNAKKLMSYSKYPISSEQLLDANLDIYGELLTYTTNENTHVCWSMIEYDSLQQTCTTFFKGVHYRFNSIELANYRFSVILKTSEPLTNDVFSTSLVKNDTFKTLTLIINFYIPDPILTSIERGKDFYYLDRALLYFSNEIYSTIDKSIDFGDDRISLSLYDTSTQKIFLGSPVTYNWFYQIPSSEQTAIWVGRGDSSIFNVQFTDLIAVGQSFEIYYNETDPDTGDIFYSMSIQFNNILEVQNNYFWCSEIIVNSQNDSYNVYSEYSNNENIFNENNVLYISKAIAKELANYAKIVTTSANNARYKEISLANIKTYLSYTSLQINASSKYLSISIVEPTEFRSLIKYKSVNNQILQLPTSYTFPMARHKGQYIPQTRTLSKFSDGYAFNNIYPSTDVDSYSYRSVIDKLSTSMYSSTSYIDKSLTSNSTNAFEILSSGQSEQLDWIANPIEYRNRYSLVFNSDEKITVSTKLTESINLVDLLYYRILTWIDYSSLTNQEMLAKLSKINYSVTEQTITNFDPVRNIVQSFLLLFLKIYRIDSISKTDGQIVQFNMTHLSIDILFEQSININDNILITFTR